MDAAEQLQLVKIKVEELQGLGRFHFGRHRRRRRPQGGPPQGVPFQPQGGGFSPPGQDGGPPPGQMMLPSPPPPAEDTMSGSPYVRMSDLAQMAPVLNNGVQAMPKDSLEVDPQLISMGDGMGDVGDLSSAASSPVAPLVGLIGLASVGLSAYHGYKRNQSIPWAVAWGALGGLFPIVTPAIAFAQGFGKPIEKPATAN